MRTECTCGVVLVDEPAVDGMVSHGLCPTCYRAMMRSMLEGLSFTELTYELEVARQEFEAAVAYIGAVLNAQEIDRANAKLAEAKEWLALVEVEVESRGGRT